MAVYRGYFSKIPIMKVSLRYIVCKGMVSALRFSVHTMLKSVSRKQDTVHGAFICVRFSCCLKMKCSSCEVIFHSLGKLGGSIHPWADRTKMYCIRDGFLTMQCRC